MKEAVDEVIKRFYARMDHVPLTSSELSVILRYHYFVFSLLYLLLLLCNNWCELYQTIGIMFKDGMGLINMLMHDSVQSFVSTCYLVLRYACLT